MKLVAVTKNHPVDAVQEALSLGIKAIGENRVQEAKEKHMLVKNGEWHLIGHLQTNKAKQAVEIFDLIESVDSVRLLEEINKFAIKQNKRQSILLQVNIAREVQKSGFLIEDYKKIVDDMYKYDNLLLKGIMVIAPICDDEEEVRPIFKTGYEEFIKLKNKYPKIEILSMGMSHDFGVAIEEGANSVRVGTALFGKRDYNN